MKHNESSTKTQRKQYNKQRKQYNRKTIYITMNQLINQNIPAFFPFFPVNSRIHTIHKNLLTVLVFKPRSAPRSEPTSNPSMMCERTPKGSGRFQSLSRAKHGGRCHRHWNSTQPRRARGDGAARVSRRVGRGAVRLLFLHSV